MNPIPELISNEDYEKVKRFIHKEKLRNYLIKREYKELRKTMTLEKACMLLGEKYFLSWETIRNIMYPKWADRRKE